MPLLHKYLLSAHVTDSKWTWLLCPAPAGGVQPSFLVWGEDTELRGGTLVLGWAGASLGRGRGRALTRTVDVVPVVVGAGTRSPRSGQRVPTRTMALQKRMVSLQG